MFKFKIKDIILNKFSFTIIELSVGLAVMGVLGAGGLVAYKNTNPQLKSDLKKIQEIEEKIQQFFNTNGRLPYPAYYKDSKESGNYLKENNNNIKTLSVQGDQIKNNILFGVVPTRTLNLPDDYAYDSNGKNIEYVVHSVLAESIGQENNGYQKENYSTNRNGSYSVLYRNIEDEKSTITISPNLNIISNTNNQTTTQHAGFVLLSKQKQDKCYISIKSNKIDENSPSDSKLLNNCFTNNNLSAFYQGYNKSFDEVVVYMDLESIIYKTASSKEALNEISQGNVIKYQPRISEDLNTDNKDIVSAINEINDKVKFVDTFQRVVGKREQLYYLYKEEDSFVTADGTEKSYKRGLYVYEENENDSSLNDFKLVSGAGGGVPVGGIVAYPGTSTNPPGGFFWCDGSQYHKKIYSELYKVIGDKYTPEAERASNMFRVPDLTDKIPWQSGDLSGSKEIGEIIQAGLPNINGRIWNAYQGTRAWGAGSDGAFSLGWWHGDNSWEDDIGGYSGFTFNANNGAVIKDIYRDDAKTVQPPAMSMRFMIRYTADEEKFKEVLDFTDEVKRQLAEALIKEKIQDILCESIYPVGSVYMNFKDGTNPNYLLGCGTWSVIDEPGSVYLASMSSQGMHDSVAYNDHTIAGLKYLPDSLPSLTGRISEVWRRADSTRWGVFRDSWQEDGNKYPTSSSNARKWTIDFNSCNGNSIYCGTLVRPKSVYVWIWFRVS